MNKEKKAALLGIIGVLALFIISSYFVQRYLDTITLLIKPNLLSAIIYILIVIVATVIAPVNALPLLPLASSLWGGFTAAVLSILGWVIGAGSSLKIYRYIYL